MKKTLTLALIAVFACAPVFAADTKADLKMAADTKMTPQQEKMKTCLSAKPAPPPKAESKMAMCNKKTAGMKADERAKAQSECMKG